MMLLTDAQARVKVLALLAVMREDYGGFDRWERRLSADEYEELILAIMAILQGEDPP